MMEPEIDRSALIVVDMQNDFVHREGDLAQRARDVPSPTDMAFLMGAIPHVARLAEAFRKGGRPVIYLVHAVKPDYSDAQFPYWRLGLPRGGNRTFVVEGTWGAQIVDDLKPREGEHVVMKKGFNGFSNTPLDTILRKMGVTTCVVCGVTTSVCVSTTVRAAVEHNYRVILAEDAVADRSRDAHAAELKTMARIFADVKTTGEVIAMLAGASPMMS